MSKKRRTWSREDIQTLRELYEGTPVLVLAKKLQRPIRSVYAKGDQLGLCRNNNRVRPRHLRHLRASGKVGTVLSAKVILASRNIIVYPANTVMANGSYHAAGSKVAMRIFEKYGIEEWRLGNNSQIIRQDGVTVQVFPTGAPKKHGFPKTTGDAL